MKSLLGLTAAVLTLSNIAFLPGNAQQQQPPDQPSTVQDQMSKFRSKAHSFGVSVPGGWVIQDLSDADTNSLLTEMLHGYRILAQLCPQDQAFHGIGGTYNCNEARDLVYINRYPKLSEEPEFASISKDNYNSTAANEYFLKYQIRKLEELGNRDVRVINNTGTVINVTNMNTNNTIAEVPANLLEMAYTKNSTETRAYILSTATNAISNIGMISGYAIIYEGDAAKMPSSNLPQSVNQVFRSFEFVKEEDSQDSSIAADRSGGGSANSTSPLSERPPPIALPSAILQYEANNTVSTNSSQNIS